MIETSLAGNSLPVLQSQLLLRQPGVTHFFTLRGASDFHTDPYGEINLCDYVGDSPEHVRMSRRRVAEALSIGVGDLRFPRQVHGCEIAVVDAFSPVDVEADAVITCEAGLCIGVSTADCVPVLFADTQGRAVAAVHAGWRGTVAGIVRKAVGRFCEVAACRPDEIVAVIGPSISPEAFEVGDEVAECFREAGFGDCILRKEYLKPHIDLWQANAGQLLDAGVQLEMIDCTPLCTYTSYNRLFSARRLGTASGRIASCIMLKSSVTLSDINGG